MLLTAITPSRGQHARSRATLPERIHLLGIAGAGMQSLARLLVERGHRVTGSDAKPQACGWAARHGLRSITKDSDVSALPNDAQLIIASDAVPREAPQLAAARHRGLPQRSYAETLGVLMRERVGIAVAGTHGKSSTAAMLAEILVAARLDPTVVVGATSLDGDPVACHGRGPHMIAEACEYRANFLNLSPSVAAILNIEADHFDCYASPAHLDDAFAAFMHRIPAQGQLVINTRCTRTVRLAEDAGREIITFGRSDTQSNDEVDWRATDIELRSGCAVMNLVHHSRLIGVVRLRVAGRHQIENALAAAALAHSVGVQSGAIVSGLNNFRGLHRRLEKLGEFGGVQFVDDYAHHPTEVAAALCAVRSMFPRRRMWCIFQPHQASRTANLLDEFAASLATVDKLAVADIFRAREGAVAVGEITAPDLARQTATHGVDILQVHATNDILEHVQSAVRPGDVVVTLGAGDIGNLAHALIDRLRTHRAAG